VPRLAALSEVWKMRRSRACIADSAAGTFSGSLPSLASAMAPATPIFSPQNFSPGLSRTFSTVVTEGSFWPFTQ
jgi:hypothetical protein